MRTRNPARVLPDMSEQHGKATASGTDTGARSDEGMRILSYLLAGLLFYGGLGFVGDQVFNTSWLLPVGLIVGVVLSIYLVIKRYGSVA